MARAHAVGGWVVLAAVLVFLGTAVAGARSKVPARLFDRARVGLVALVALQVVLGAIAYAIGKRPEEQLHILYGIAALMALPLAERFAQEAPAPARAGTLAIAAAVMLALVARSFGTG